MSEQTPSQAEGDRLENASDDAPRPPEHRDVPRTTPSQAEGDDTEKEEGDLDE
ncbi:hypothetical protein [Streptomyces sp. BK205]|uniref:hypothetical protein n=1 Tax=Streptomyces TaxID=1883 RepID=UPI0010F10CA2|nr:hypothetical protein [Streptomyces sp. BK205]TCR26567.1 hypothetical protein EV578_101517 [Streptomyces sp. BK205]